MVVTVMKYELRHCANFCQKRSNCGGDISLFQDGGRRHLGFLKLQMFNGRNGPEGQTASSCEISSTSLEPRLRYAIFRYSKWRPLPSYFLQCRIFNRRTRQECRTASKCQISWRSVKPVPRYDDLSIFPRWWPSAILDLWCVCTNDGHLVVFITVQNLVGIDAVVSIICTFLADVNSRSRSLYAIASRSWNPGTRTESVLAQILGLNG